jgi:hypothetical protein
MMFSDQQWYLVGITSYGKGCALASHAGVYTRVPVYAQSIDCILKNDTTCIKKIFVVRNSVSSISISLYMNCFFVFLLFFDNLLHIK